MTIGEKTQGAEERVAASRYSPHWCPRWILPTRSGYGEVGLVVDDHCFVVLLKNQSGRGNADEWIPVKHMPEVVAEQIGNLVAAGALKS